MPPVRAAQAPQRSPRRNRDRSVSIRICCGCTSGSSCCVQSFFPTLPYALPLRTDAADPRTCHVLARPDVLPYRSPAPGHLLGLEAHDPTALLHLLDDLKAGAHLVEERREHRSQFLVFGKLLIQNIFEDRRVALGFFFEASQSVSSLLVPGPFGFKRCEHSLRLLISFFADVPGELLRPHGHIRR